jgi:hypothetical protein
MRSGSAIAVLLSVAALADFCGPLRAWQAAGFAKAAVPAPIKTMSEFIERAPPVTTRRRAVLRRAVVRMRAAGMSRAARQSFV